MTERTSVGIAHHSEAALTALKIERILRQREELLQLDWAESINDLRIPPGNQLEKLSDDRAGQHWIRVNDQCRICFTSTTAGPADVEIVDYH